MGAVGKADGRAAGHIVEENSRAVVVGRNAAEEKRGIADAALCERADQTARGGAELGAGDVRGVRRGDGKEGAVLRRSAAVGEHTVRMKVELALALDDDLRAGGFDVAVLGVRVELGAAQQLLRGVIAQGVRGGKLTARAHAVEYERVGRKRGVSLAERAGKVGVAAVLRFKVILD